MPWVKMADLLSVVTYLLLAIRELEAQSKCTCNRVLPTILGLIEDLALMVCKVL